MSRENATVVARHLVAAGRLLDEDPETAYAHAQAALGRAARVDVVREAVALTAYATGRYAEALRELRAARRLSGLEMHRAVEADCERGLGRPERALALVNAPEARLLPPTERVELAIVASGARLDLGEPEAALLVLDSPAVRAVRDDAVGARVALARANALDALGREEEARQARAAGGADDRENAGVAGPDEGIVVFDLEEESA